MLHLNLDDKAKQITEGLILYPLANGRFSVHRAEHPGRYRVRVMSHAETVQTVLEALAREIGATTTKAVRV